MPKISVIAGSHGSPVLELARRACERSTAAQAVPHGIIIDSGVDLRNSSNSRRDTGYGQSNNASIRGQTSGTNSHRGRERPVSGLAHVAINTQRAATAKHKATQQARRARSKAAKASRRRNRR